MNQGLIPSRRNKRASSRGRWASTTDAYSVGTSGSEEGRRFGPGPRDTGGAAVSFARLTGVDHHRDVVPLQQNTTDGPKNGRNGGPQKNMCIPP